MVGQEEKASELNQTMQLKEINLNVLAKEEKLKRYRDNTDTSTRRAKRDAKV